MKKNFFIIEKIKKYRKCPALKKRAFGFGFKRFDIVFDLRYAQAENYVDKASNACWIKLKKEPSLPNCQFALLQIKSRVHK